MISEVSRNVTRELGIDWSIDLNPFEIPLRTWATGTGLRLGERRTAARQHLQPSGEVGG